MKTSKGDIALALDSELAPLSVSNFLNYTNAQFYDGTIFHRVIDDFMIQGGGFDINIKAKETYSPIGNEADNGLSNLRGTIAMARTSDPYSATAQFFINVVDNTFLDYTEKTSEGWGYAVFGKVVSGIDTVDSIRVVSTGAAAPFSKDVPIENIVINTAETIACSAAV
ncbi:MAG: peptidylprolyl isomerase [Gammaproteobacteria bacterium]|nr:peptidylprolyl isomerase [Gammaproteobacteria bacterium]